MKKGLAAQLDLNPGRPPVPAPQRQSVKPPRSFREPQPRQDGRMMIKKSVYLTEETYLALGTWARQNRLTDSDAIERAVRALVGLE